MAERSHTTLRVPRECGRVLAVPSLDELPARIARPPSRAHRAPLLERAAAYTAVVDGTSLSMGAADRPLFVTGHQPEFYHPGIWVKNFIVEALCRAHGWQGLNLTVDADLPGARTLTLPRHDGGEWRRGGVDLPGVHLGVPWEKQPPLDRSAWDALLETVRGALPAELYASFDAYTARVRTHAPVFVAHNLADSLLRARRAWETRDGALSYLELPISVLCASDLFFAFVVEVLARLREFWHTHNEVLTSYRLAHRIRSAANPVPNLRERDGLWETPFWCVHADGERGGLFLERDGEGWKVESKDAVFGRLDDATIASWPAQLREMLEAAGAGVRPRALTLTMFVRRHLADLFLHGVGGARYERVNDLITERFFGASGAPYAVGTATFWPDLGTPADGGARVRGLSQTLRDMHYNPQRFLAAGEAAEDVARKMALIETMHGTARGARRALREQMRGLNARLCAYLDAPRRRMREALASAQAAQVQFDVTGWRGYPYFLFKPETLRAAVATAVRPPVVTA